MLVKFTMQFRRNFLESMKTIHFWKAYNIRNQKNYVYICSDSDMAAILHFVQNGRYETGFCKYLSKIFLESMKTMHIWKAYNIRNQKKRCLHWHRVQYGRHLAFVYKWPP